MSNAWPEHRLGDALTPSEDWIEVQPDETYREVTVKLWGKGVIERGEVEGATIAGTRRKRVRARQFILSRIDARNGALGLVPPALEGAIVSNDFPVFAVDESVILPEFLGWLSRTQGFVELCKHASEGTTNRVRLKEGRFLDLKLRFPDPPEQKRIVARIEELTRKLEEVQKLRDEVEELAGGMIASLHNELAGRRTRKLGQILELQEDAVPVSIAGNYPQVGVKSFGNGLFQKATTSGDQTTYKAFNRLFPGALVLSQVKAWEGAIAVCPANLSGWFVSPEYRTFRCVPSEARSGYLAHLVRTKWFWGRFVDATRGVGDRRERTRPEQFLALELPMPSVENQEFVEGVLLGLDTLQGLEAGIKIEFDAISPSILVRAFAGEL